VLQPKFYDFRDFKIYSTNTKSQFDMVEKNVLIMYKLWREKQREGKKCKCYNILILSLNHMKFRQHYLFSPKVSSNYKTYKLSVF
jgi:hypothetical protein